MSLAEFKLYLVSPTGQPSEVHRIIGAGYPGRDGAYQFVCLKMEQMFPILAGKTYKIYWKDEDGDLINADSDDEVALAIAKMSPNGVVKLYVKLVKTCETVHEGISCDNCNMSPVVGYRYKCMDCFDYDLCASCESNGVHPEHRVVRLSAPVATKRMFHNLMRDHFAHRRFEKHWGKRGACFTEPQQGTSSSEEEQTDCPFFQEKRKKHGKEEKKDKDHHHKHGKEEKRDHRHKHGHGHHDRRRQCGYLGNLWRQYGEAAAMSAGAAANAAASAAAAGTSAAAGAANHMASEPGHLQYLRTIGQTVANLLDPLGIAVDIDVRGKEAQTQTRQQETPEGAQQPTPQEAPAGQQTGPASGAQQTPSEQPREEVMFPDFAPIISEGIKQITEALAQQHVDAGDAGWTVLNPEFSPSHSPREATPAPMESQQQQTQSQTSPDGVYPDLTPSAPQMAPHPNVLVQQSLAKLLAMGFSNENGILSQILEIHNGDLYKALDILTIIRK